LRSEVEDLEVFAEKGQTLRALKKAFFVSYGNSDPLFFETSLESFPLMQQELKLLEKLKESNGGALFMEERLNELKAGKNRITFVEDGVFTKGGIKETIERQSYPVALDEDDLQKLLAMIDHVKINNFEHPRNTPQIWVKNFSLVKQRGAQESKEVFNLEMTLIKREFLADYER
jgi:hypothetical protein